ncbi:MAG: o-succinylbenzoate synthase [Cryomorphaceae bacterium]
MATVRWKQYALKFKQPSGTSRGVLTTKHSFFFLSDDPSFEYPAIGECSLIEGLSPDPSESYFTTLDAVCAFLGGKSDALPDLTAFPSIQMGVETLEKDIASSGSKKLFDHAFTQGREGMQINGLVWMGDRAFMRKQIIDKLEAGFDCIKMKIGAIDFETELELLKFIRNEFGHDIELRVDANGAFSMEDALIKLEKLASYRLHSIEQPIQQGHWESMAFLCEKSPVPIALDEELIGIQPLRVKRTLLETIRPAYIILKPSLHGGMQGSDEWIAIANELGVNWWITSALESNVGLNAIAQYAFSYKVDLPQGLGTGGLYSNNFESPLYLQGQIIRFKPDQSWDLRAIIP